MREKAMTKRQAANPSQVPKRAADPPQNSHQNIEKVASEDQ
ncbi:hypothetical protein X971_2888 [Agrobacterium tumefaciens LBA4213 (Ach5)]|nr:hypothetical protein X971_2888 [Agrobacterium tumefaciens LBA4213 (Ach5)]